MHRLVEARCATKHCAANSTGKSAAHLNSVFEFSFCTCLGPRIQPWGRIVINVAAYKQLDLFGAKDLEG